VMDNLSSHKGPAGADALEQALALAREGQADTSSVALVAYALEEACLLEPVDVTGERGGGDPLLGGQLAQAQARVAADQPEKRDLSARDAELLGLFAQLSRQPKEHGPKLVGDGERIGDNVINH